MTQSSSGGNELQRGIKGWQVTFIGLGGVIGSCYFLGIGVCVRTMGPAVLLGFAIVSFVIYAVMVAYAELLVNVPRTGSFISYTKEFLGPQWSIGMGWAFWCNWVAFVPSECIALASTVKYMTGSDSPVLYVSVAVGALAVVTIINIAAVSLFSRVEGILGITKVSVIILFIVVAIGIWLGLWGNENAFIGTSVNFGGAASLMDELFPKGSLIVFTQMTLILVTCEGTELIGLAAAESQ
ncbi:MAG: amino acid permease, partial [Lentihominibacter sp.]